jgi:adenosine deaminase CECR1
MSPITDEEWEEIYAQEVPAKDSAVIKSYLQGREALIAEEKKQRSGTSHLDPYQRTPC